MFVNKHTLYTDITDHMTSKATHRGIETVTSCVINVRRVCRREVVRRSERGLPISSEAVCSICNPTSTVSVFRSNYRVKITIVQIRRGLLAYLEHIAQEIRVFVWPIRTPDERNDLHKFVGKETRHSGVVG